MIKNIDATILIGEAFSDVINVAEFSSGFLYMPAVWTAADIAFVVAQKASGTFNPLLIDADLVDISGPAVDSVYVLPSGLFDGGSHIKLWSQLASVDTVQAAERLVRLSFK